jgi:acyl carrier protein
MIVVDRMIGPSKPVFNARPLGAAMDKIRAFMEEQFLVEFDETLTEDSNLFKEGIMDSFGYVQLCRFLEKEYGITFTEEEMTSNVLVSLTQIRDTVTRKVAALSAAS